MTSLLRKTYVIGIENITQRPLQILDNGIHPSAKKSEKSNNDNDNGHFRHRHHYRLVSAVDVTLRRLIFVPAVNFT